MIHDKILTRKASDLAEKLDSDLSFVRREVITLLQETADVRASMREFGSRRPSISKRYVAVLGATGLVLVALMLIYQVEMQAWVHHLLPQAAKEPS